MYKCIDVGSWDFGIKTAEIIPVSSRGLTAADSNSFFTKRANASQEAFKKVLETIKLAKDEIPIHLVAMGASESYGPNKNGDGFDRETLKSQHPTFVKEASPYYHHENKDKKKRYGKVAASHYNEDMDRVELLVLFNGSKEAADKNGGLVAPDSDIQALYEGKELPWSMGCKVKKDVCSSCKNAAATPRDYCEEHECIDSKGIQRFGCKSGLTKTAEDGFVQYVDNPNCTFIDISRVSTPADRTAYGAIAKYAAEANSVLGGAELAFTRGLADFDEVIIKTAALQGYSDILEKLAWLEASLRNSPKALSESLGFRGNDVLPERVAKYARTIDAKDVCNDLMHLADFNIVLGPRQFAKYAGYEVSDSFPEVVCGLFGQLDRAVDNRTALLAECEKYAGCKKNTSLPPYYHLYKTANQYTQEGMHQRLVESVLVTPLTKAAKVNTTPATDYKAAIEYCLYKVAALTRLQNELHCVTAVIQNLV